MTTQYFRNLIAGNLFNVGSPDPIPSGYYLGLSSTAPTDSGANVSEPTSAGSGYARVLLTQLGSPNNGVVKNETDITFPKAVDDWFPAGSAATHYVVFDASQSGNLLIYGELTKSRVIESDTYISFPAGELTISIV